MNYNLFFIPLVYLLKSLIENIFNYVPNVKKYLSIISLLLVSLILYSTDNHYLLKFDIIAQKFSFIERPYELNWSFFVLFIAIWHTFKIFHSNRLKIISIENIYLFFFLILIKPSFSLLVIWWIVRFLNDNEKTLLQSFVHNFGIFILIVLNYINESNMTNHFNESYIQVFRFFNYFFIALFAIFSDELFSLKSKLMPQNILLTIIFTLFYIDLSLVESSKSIVYYLVFTLLISIKLILDFYEFKKLRYMKMFSILLIGLAIFYQEQKYFFLLNYVGLRTILEIYNYDVDINVTYLDVFKRFNQNRNYQMILFLSLAFFSLTFLSVMSILSDYILLSFILISWFVFKEYVLLCYALLKTERQKELIYFHGQFWMIIISSLGFLWF